MKTMKGFERWYSENKESEHLWDTYRNCCMDLEGSSGEKPPTFKQWCREYYVKLIGVVEDFS